MIILPLAIAATVATTTYTSQSQQFLSALTREFDPSLVPHFYQIAVCESSLRQWKADGSVLVSSTTDYGILQINKVHEDAAAKLGLDFKGSIEDNVKMAKIVYDEREARGLNGFGAWTCAKKVGVI